MCLNEKESSDMSIELLELEAIANSDAQYIFEKFDKNPNLKKEMEIAVRAIKHADDNHKSIVWSKVLWLLSLCNSLRS